jgi:hypothetical protein
VTEQGLDFHAGERDSLERLVEQLRLRNQTMREALEKIADNDNYPWTTARAALAEGGQGE